MTRNRISSAVERSAFAPGHLTGLFAPRLEARDPRDRGSIGAGVVLDAGVTATARWDPGRSTRTDVHADVDIELPISHEVARRLRRDATGLLEIELRHDLPIGQGFGMSAAGALATALSVGAVLGRPRREAIEVAHLADLFGGGGLGGVSAILGGGWETRRSPGVRRSGIVDHRPFRRSIVIATVGAPIPSPRVLSSPLFLERVSRAIAGPMAAVERSPTEETFLAASAQFTDALRLGPPRVTRVIRSLRRHTPWVAQTMFGGSVWIVARSTTVRRSVLRELDSRGLRAIELGASPTGAALARRRAPAARKA